MLTFLNPYSLMLIFISALSPHSLSDFWSKMHVPVTSFVFYWVFILWLHFFLSVFHFFVIGYACLNFLPFCSFVCSEFFQFLQHTSKTSNFHTTLLCVLCLSDFEKFNFFSALCLSLSLNLCFAWYVRAFDFTGFAGSFTAYLSKVDTHEWSLKCLASVLNGYAHTRCSQKYTYVCICV